MNGLSANSSISTICSDSSGNIYAAGYFDNSSGKKYVAKWDGTSWSELGGLNGLAANSDIRSICSDASGNIYAAGDFINSAGKKYVAKWNGISWSELGGLGGLSAGQGIFSICTDPSGNIYAGGHFVNSSPWFNKYVAVYSTTTGLNLNEDVQNFIVFPNPARNKINVKADAKLLGSAYSLFDNAGRIVLSGLIISENTTVEIDNLSNGTYFFNIGQNMKQAFKVLKE